MDALSMNTLRIVLVGLTAIAALLAAVYAMWSVAAFLTVGVIAHGLMWVHLKRQRERDHDHLHRSVEDLLQPRED